MSKEHENSTISVRIDFQQELNEAIDKYSDMLGFNIKQADFIRMALKEKIKQLK